MQRVTEKAASTAKSISDVATGTKSSARKTSKATGVAGLVDPMQLWGSLTQQFQQIAAGALKEASAKTAVDVTKNMASGMAKEAVKSAKAAAKSAGRRAVAAPAKKTTRPRSR